MYCSLRPASLENRLIVIFFPAENFLDGEVEILAFWKDCDDVLHEVLIEPFGFLLGQQLQQDCQGELRRSTAVIALGEARGRVGAHCQRTSRLERPVAQEHFAGFGYPYDQHKGSFCRKGGRRRQRQACPGSPGRAERFSPAPPVPTLAAPAGRSAARAGPPPPR